MTTVKSNKTETSSVSSETSGLIYGLKLAYDRRRWSYGGEYLIGPVQGSASAQSTGVFVQRRFKQFKLNATYFVLSTIKGSGGTAGSGSKVGLGYRIYYPIWLNVEQVTINFNKFEDADPDTIVQSFSGARSFIAVTFSWPWSSSDEFRSEK